MTPKNTPQRVAILDSLRKAGGFRTAQQVYDDVRSGGRSIGLATVYRNLAVLSETKEVDVLHPPGSEAIYRVCISREHHHHLVCRACGTAVEIGSPDVEEWAAKSAHEHKFRAVTHTAELYGVCAECS